MDYNKIKKYKAIVKKRGSDKEKIVYGYLSIGAINYIYDEDSCCCKQKLVSYVFVTDETDIDNLSHMSYPNYIYSPKVYEEDEFRIIDDDICGGNENVE